jgi:glycosyltransferase involved in cell wall biosynthesis
MSVALLIPVLNRPGNVAPLLASIQATTPTPYRVLFICDPGDVAEQDAIAKAGGEMISPGGGYARKIRAGIDATDEPLIFIGADDLRFHQDWLPTALAQMNGVQVVGVNDTIRRRRPQHATHFLMTRDYALLPTLTGEPGPLCELYSHSFVDDELIATATHRGVYAYAANSIVQHRHWMAGTAPDDATYRLGREDFAKDRATFMARSHLWTT